MVSYIYSMYFQVTQNNESIYNHIQSELFFLYNFNSKKGNRLQVKKHWRQQQQQPVQKKSCIAIQAIELTVPTIRKYLSIYIHFYFQTMYLDYRWKLRKWVDMCVAFNLHDICSNYVLTIGYKRSYSVFLSFIWMCLQHIGVARGFFKLFYFFPKNIISQGKPDNSKIAKKLIFHQCQKFGKKNGVLEDGMMKSMIERSQPRMGKENYLVNFLRNLHIIYLCSSRNLHQQYFCLVKVLNYLSNLHQ